MLDEDLISLEWYPMAGFVSSSAFSGQFWGSSVLKYQDDFYHYHDPSPPLQVAHWLSQSP